MDRRGIYPDGFLCMFRVSPTTWWAAIIRQPHTIGKKHSKIPIFSTFLEKLRALKGIYGLDVLNQGRGYHVTPFGAVLENFVHFRLVNYTKNRPKMVKNGQKWPKWTFFRSF